MIWWVILIIIVIIIIIIGLCIIYGLPNIDHVSKQLGQKLKQIHKRYDPSKDVSQYVDIPIYYINLNRSTDRNATMIQRFQTYGITDYTRVQGVDGSDDPSVNYSADFRFITITSGEIGCTLSHLRAIKMAYDRGLPYALIMEDDTSFDLVPLWDRPLSAWVREAGRNWRILQLYSNYNYAKIPKSKYQTLFSTQRNCRGCVAYIINRDGMKAVLKRAWDGTKFIISKDYASSGEADIYVYSLAGYNQRYLTYPPLFIPFNVSTPSTFHSHHDLDHMKQTIVCLDTYL